MATLSAKVFKHHKKTDGTFNVKVCIHKTIGQYQLFHYISVKWVTYLNYFVAFLTIPDNLWLAIFRAMHHTSHNCCAAPTQFP